MLGAFFLMRVETLNLRFKVVFVSLRSVQYHRPPDVVGSPLRFGPRKTKVHWTLCALSPAYAERVWKKFDLPLKSLKICDMI